MLKLRTIYSLYYEYYLKQLVLIVE
jgi:hypothetical protein